MTVSKPLEFCGDSLERLRSFPKTARSTVGRQLDRVQDGLDPNDWKPMNTIGPGVREIRIRDERGIFRVMYVAKFAEAIFVLHCFQKKTQKTSAADLEIASRRYNALTKEQEP